jgi:hypothetical protein
MKEKNQNFTAPSEEQQLNVNAEAQKKEDSHAQDEKQNNSSDTYSDEYDSYSPWG